MLVLAGMLVVALAAPASAQTNSKVYRDVTVHPNNYKHPNKAAMRPVQGIEFRETYRKAPSIADYKEQQRRGGHLEAAIAIPAKDVVVSENRHYKQQNLNVKSRRKEATQPTIEPVTQEEIGN